TAAYVPDGRIGIYMILAMIEPRCHLGNRSLSDRVVMLARRFAALGIAGLLSIVPASSQTYTGSGSHTAVTAQVEKPDLPTPKPDRGRARNAFEQGRRAEQAGDWKTEYADYSEAATYDPTNRQYTMLKEHARFQVVQSL